MSEKRSGSKPESEDPKTSIEYRRNHTCLGYPDEIGNKMQKKEEKNWRGKVKEPHPIKLRRELQRNAAPNQRYKKKKKEENNQNTLPKTETKDIK